LQASNATKAIREQQRAFPERLMTPATRLNCCPKIPDLSGVIAANATASAAVDAAGFEAHARG